MASKQPSTQIKVCLVAISLGSGGAERSTALLSQMLSEKGFAVSIVILNNVVDYPYQGNLFNLGELKTKNDTVTKRLKRFKKLRSFFIKENFDYIIDNRTRSNTAKEIFYLHYLYKNQRIVYVVRSFNILQYFPKQRWIAKKMIEKSEAIVGVSKAIAHKINIDYQTQKSIAIYNPIERFSEKETGHTFNERYILYLGRIEENVKNFTLLLSAYKASKLPENNIHLNIVGDGPDVDFVQNKIIEMGLSKVVTMHSFTPHVFTYLKNALYLTLTSYYEGFPRVLIEALSVGTPVLSVDCKSGPNEIIVNKENGLLVKNHDIDELVEGMNQLALDTPLYIKCKENAIKSVSHLSMDAVAQQWETLLKRKK